MSHDSVKHNNDRQKAMNGSTRSKLTNFFKQSRANKLIAVGVTLVVLVAGYIILGGRAGGFFAFFESEQASISGNAKLVSDNGATGGQAIEFGPTTSAPPATPNPAPGAVTNVSSISQYGITWTFDKPYPSGQYATGDYWVQGPVKITSMTPGFDGSNHGWEVNPVTSGGQGFEGSVPDFNAGLVPALPYNAQPGQSVVKAISNTSDGGDCRESIKVVGILTVVGTPPLGNGAAVFRPPYVGTDKREYKVSSLRTDLLPSYAPVANTPSLDSVVQRFKPPQFSHKNSNAGVCMRPTDAMPFYGAAVAQGTNEGALRLMMNDSVSAKMPALIAYVQGGIDYYHAILGGMRWTAGLGEQPGQKLMPVFASVLLDNQDMKNTMRNVKLYEDEHLQVGKGNVVIFGHMGGTTFGGPHSEDSYWSLAASDGSAAGNKTQADPYGYIDGGPAPGDWYHQCCTSAPFKGVGVSLKLMPVLQQVWNFPQIITYAERWTTVGAWAQPDPCAPAIGTYKVNYGPDGKGGCILDTNPADGIGRFPQNQGKSRDNGGYGSKFVDSMYGSYWK